MPEDVMNGAFQCTQQPGDLFFIPELWAHAILNVDTTVALAFELSLPQGETDTLKQSSLRYDREIFRIATTGYFR